ncbi:MAG: VanZ family protein [Burkholderiales bacterium PBB5]|nr:MAG: VanZ family protein [Burkholderiales bacterium PBB5]
MPTPPAQVSLGWDKLNHASAFATLAVVVTLGWGRRWLRHALLLLAYGALIEVLQAMTPTRSAEWADLLADGVGLTTGLLLVAGLLAATERRWHTRHQ